MKKKFIISFCVTAIMLISAITSNIFAIEGDAYAPGRAVIKVTETFSQITTNADSIIETEKPWFNQSRYIGDEIILPKYKKIIELSA